MSISLDELNDAISYYEDVEEGLGHRFYREIRNSLDRVKSYPEAWDLLSERTRRCRTKVFPYGIIYQIRKDEILVVAIMHLRRHPGHWEERV